MKRPTRAALIALLLAAACGGNAPDDHTIDKDGALHKSGLEEPTQNCAECHGAELRGGDATSCYECHGQLWR